MSNLYAAMNNGIQGHDQFVRYAFDKPMFIPTFEQAEQMDLAKEVVSEQILEEMKDNRELFFKFMDSFCENEETFNRFADLFKEMLLNEKEYLDTSIELRVFGRICLMKFADKEAFSRIIAR